MTDAVEARLSELGIVLPAARPPAANYVPVVAGGGLHFVSGQIPTDAGGVRYVGKVGREFSIEEGREAARLCGINILAQVKTALGGFDRLVRIVKVVGFVNAVPDFTDPQLVVNGASDLLTEVLGDRGRHARSAVGVATLPLGVAVEVEAIVEAR